ncbi:hypothetical protein [Collinsella stercoris]|uniref:Uncharacterized protein n=1 Tax=Collinsella stercoris DSM 13279 TaxID=445975 RepID=B6G8M0_9ACTN|nr:hypothetical protein [Collinsella stercoris]EEA91369.1 hypothetical protein COLSTE_00411 [Collinsella stercoris DSM 13279]UEA44725.1 hypothetical protein LK434_06115 [Collinsella stercoris DSM 13279]UWP10808.1 hypothetical protein NQ498_05890 [Collinsella stercoris]
MIKTSFNGNIVIEVGGRSYDLSVSDQYADFLLWVTSPDEKTVIDQDTFKVAEDVPEEHQAKAARYADFLTDYSQRRQSKLNDIKQTLNTDQRESDIKAFIERLANTEA